MFAHVPTQVKPSIPYQFIALPVEILRRSDLSAAAKLLAAVVLDNARSSRSGSCKLTNAGLGDRIGRSAASVKRLLSELEDAGIVRRDHVAEKHQRTAVVVTWGVAQESTTVQTSAARDRPTPGAEMSRPPVQESAAIQSPEVRELSDGETSLSLSEEKTPDLKPTPAEIAAALRLMVAGKHAPMMFEAKVAADHRAPTGGSPASPPPAPDVRALARRVGYSAVAAIAQGRAPRKSADVQLAELAARRIGRNSP